jgi:hypothetical protein
VLTLLTLSNKEVGSCGSRISSCGGLRTSIPTSPKPLRRLEKQSRRCNSTMHPWT